MYTKHLNSVIFLRREYVVTTWFRWCMTMTQGGAFSSQPVNGYLLLQSPANVVEKVPNNEAADQHQTGRK